jgi:hypothetical protein
MSLRNENIGLLVALLIMFTAYSITDWDPSDSTAQATFAVAFVTALVVSTLLNDRDDRRSRRRRRSGAER